MNKIIYSIVILVLLSNLYLLKINNSLKEEIELKNSSIKYLSTENNTIRPQFLISLANINHKLNDTTIIKDIYGNKKSLHEYMSNQEDNILLFRYSEYYCNVTFKIYVLCH